MIGVLGVALALLALVWLLAGESERALDSDAFATEPSAVVPAASALAANADPADTTASRAGSETATSDRVRAAGNPGSTALRARPIRGHVVDARTQEPVPYVTVHLTAGAVDETVTTGLDGAFQSTREFAGDTLSAIVSDAGNRVQSFVHDEDARADEPWILEVSIGPTYPLSIAVGATIEPAQWSARVIESTRNFENAGEIEVDDGGLRMSAPRPDAPDRCWPWIALRAEASFARSVPWIRYPAIQFEPESRYRLRIQLRCESLGHKGLGRIHGTVGVQEPVIVDGLKDVGALTGKVHDARDVAVGGATVLLVPYGGGVPRDSRLTLTNEKGEFRLLDLLPGRHDLIAFAPRQSIYFLRGFKLTPGVTVLEDALRLPKPARPFDPDEVIDLDADPKQPVSAGKARPKGREEFFAHIRLPQADRLVRDWVQAVSDVSILSREARFQASRLPAAPLNVEWLDLFESRARVRPSLAPMRMSISAPSAKLKLEYGGREGRALRFEIEGEAENTSNFDVSFEPGGALIGEQSASELRRWSLARGAPLRWVAWRRGSAPVSGFEDAFREGKRGTLSAPIRFAPGWGAVLWCRATDGMQEEKQKIVQGLGYVSDDPERVPALHEVLASPPLPGVRVLMDGILGGTSDEEGVILLRQNPPPVRLVLVAEHWRMVRLERLPQRCAATQRYVVWMSRD